MDEFRDLRHVSAIGGLVKDDVGVTERGRYCAAIAQITFNEFHLVINPRRPSATVGLRFKVVEAAHLPTLVDEKIGNVRADQARSTSD
jgi:hypothetical protein